MSKKIELSSLSLAVLGLIAQKPQSGYDVRKVFSATPMGRFSNSPGAIYPALKRTEGRGWVRSSLDAKTTLRPRRTYRITKAGLGVLKQCLVQSVTIDDVIWRMEDLMLRFAFMDQHVSREEIIRFLNEFLTAIEAYHKSLVSYLDGASEAFSLCGRLAMEQGIEGHQIYAKWARRAIKELELES